jgi:hypothetical protein
MTDARRDGGEICLAALRIASRCAFDRGPCPCPASARGPARPLLPEVATVVWSRTSDARLPGAREGHRRIIKLVLPNSILSGALIVGITYTGSMVDP